MQTPPAQHPFLVMNPRSGGGKVARFALQERARQLGATVVLLDPAQCDLVQLMQHAVDDGADLLGAAGGDGTLAVTAGVAAERNIPFVVIPAGTRNHFAMDLGLDRAHPDKALDALVDGEEVLVDLGKVGSRWFVNTVSFGAYADIVERPDYRDDKLRVTLDVLPALLAGGEPDRFTVVADTLMLTNPTAALVSNNPYDPRDLAGLDRRPRLDSGVLGLICVCLRLPVAPPARVRDLRANPPVTITTATEVVIDAPTPMLTAAIDGESVMLETPVRCELLSSALRVRLPLSRRGHA